MELYQRYQIEDEDLPMWERIQEEWWWARGPRAERRSEDDLYEMVKALKLRREKGEFKKAWCQHKRTWDTPGMEGMTGKERRRARRQEQRWHKLAFGDHPDLNPYRDRCRVFSALLVVEQPGNRDYDFEYELLWCGCPDAASEETYHTELIWYIDWEAHNLPREELECGDVVWCHIQESWDSGSYEYPDEVDGQCTVVSALRWNMVPPKIRKRIIPWPTKQKVNPSTSPTHTLQLSDFLND